MRLSPTTGPATYASYRTPSSEPWCWARLPSSFRATCLHGSSVGLAQRRRALMHLSDSSRPAFSYRSDPSVPAFRDDKPIIIFDGHCVLCSWWAQFVIRHDAPGRYRLLPAQTPLGHALYVHYGLDPLDYETNILIEDGIAYFKMEGSLRMFKGLGTPWSAVTVLRVLPRGLRDRLYETLARNRFRMFGRRDECLMPSPEHEDRFVV